MSERDSYNPQEPTLEQQLKVWVFTHPNPDQPTGFAGQNYSPRNILTEIQQGSELGTKLKSYLERSASQSNTSPPTFIQRAIEQNLRPKNVPPALDPDSHPKLPQDLLQRARIVKTAYAGGLMRLWGVEGVGVGVLKPGNPSVHIYARMASLKEKLPYQLEGVPTRIEITGRIVAAGGFVDPRRLGLLTSSM